MRFLTLLLFLAALTPQKAFSEVFPWPAFDKKWGLSLEMFEKAQAYYNKHLKKIKNPRYVSIVNYGLKSNKKRFVLFDLKEGKVETYLTAHGRGSDPKNTGYATEFSNEEGSKQTSLGFYLTLGTYHGMHGHSLKLKGLEKSNSKAEERAIVIHPAKYVQEKVGHAGRSWGCPSLDPKVAPKVISRIQNGSLLLLAR